MQYISKIFVFCSLLFLLSFSIGMKNVYAGAPDYFPGNDPNAKRDIVNLISGEDTGTGILGKNLFANTKDDPREIVRNIINVAMGFLGMLAVATIIYAGFLWMTSRKTGEKDKVNAAKGILINGVIGLIVIFSAWTIAQFVIYALKESVRGAPGDSGGGGRYQQGEVCSVACKGKENWCNDVCMEICGEKRNLSDCKCFSASDTQPGKTYTWGRNGCTDGTTTAWE